MGLAGVGIAATVASTAVGIGSQLAKSGAVSGGQGQANAAIEPVRSALRPTSWRHGRRPGSRRTRTRPTCWG